MSQSSLPNYSLNYLNRDHSLVCSKSAQIKKAIWQMPKEPRRNQNLPRDRANSASHSSYWTEHKAPATGFQEDALQLLEVNLEKHCYFYCNWWPFLKNCFGKIRGINEMKKLQKVNIELKFTKTSYMGFRDCCQNKTISEFPSGNCRGISKQDTKSKCHLKKR